MNRLISPSFVCLVFLALFAAALGGCSGKSR